MSKIAKMERSGKAACTLVLAQALLCAWLSLQAHVRAETQGKQKTSSTATAPAEMHLSKADLVTAGGPIYVNLHRNLIKGFIGSKKWYAELMPDRWGAKEEPRKWHYWTDQFLDIVSEKLQTVDTPGQQTISITVLPNKTALFDYKGKVLPCAIERTAPGKVSKLQNDSKTAKQFNASIEKVILDSLEEAPPMPRTRNPLKEYRTSFTFCIDKEVVPRYGTPEMKICAILNQPGNNITIFVGENDPFPGVNCCNERNGPEIKGMPYAAYVDTVKKLHPGK